MSVSSFHIRPCDFSYRVCYTVQVSMQLTFFLHTKIAVPMRSPEPDGEQTDQSRMIEIWINSTMLRHTQLVYYIQAIIFRQNVYLRPEGQANVRTKEGNVYILIKQSHIAFSENR